jgi:hypothetical protein
MKALNWVANRDDSVTMPQLLTQKCGVAGHWIVA